MIFAEKPIVEYEEGFYLENLDLPQRPIKLIYLLALIVLLGVAICAYFFTNRSVESPSFLLDSFVIILMLVFIGVNKSTQSKPVNWFTPDILFTSMFVVFHFGYIILYSFNTVLYDSEVFFAPDKVHKAVLYSFCCIVLFLLGYEIAVCRCRVYIDGILSTCSKPPLILSQVMIVFAVTLFWGTFLSAGLEALKTDYMTLIKTGNRFFAVALNVGAVGLALYCASSTLLFHKPLSGPIKFLVAFYILSILIMGDRGGFIYLASIPFVAFHYFQRKIKVIVIIILMLFVLFAMAIVGVARRVVVFDVSKMFESYKTSQTAHETNAITNSIAEFGASIKTVVIAMSLIPNQSKYWKGESYLNSMRYVIPNILPGSTRIAGKTISPDIWLTETVFGDMHYTHGRGGSIAMEAYVNFGFVLGSITFFFLGWMYRKIYEKMLAQVNLFNIVFFLGAISALTYWTRNTSIMFTRTFIWSFIVAYFANKFFCSQPSRNFESEIEVLNR